MQPPVTRRGLRSVLPLLCLALTVLTAAAQGVGDLVTLQSSNSAGVPVHPGPGDRHYVRWANGTLAKVTRIDSATGWYQLDHEGSTGWVIQDYLTVFLRPEIRRPQLSPPEAFQLTVTTANQGRPLVIETSTNMIQWTPVSTNTFSMLTGFAFEDADTGASKRFYRASGW